MDNDNTHTENGELIAKYLSGEANPEEVRQLEDWVLHDKGNAMFFNFCMKTWNLSAAAAKGDAVETEKEWEKISRKIFMPSEKGVVRSLASNRRRMLFRIAAVFVLLIAAAAVLYLSQTGPAWNEFATMEKVESITLSDGSEITLNRQSLLEYSSMEGSGPRKVRLEGEAFFKVNPDPVRPFKIEIQGAEIEVLGTSFFVSSIENNSYIEVVVETGKLIFRHFEQEVVLTEGHRGVLDKKSSKLEKSLNIDPNFLSWKTGKFVFRNTPLSEVLSQFSRSFGVDFEIAEPALGKCLLTGTYEGYELDSLMDIIAETLDLTVKKDGKVILISGEACE